MHHSRTQIVATIGPSSGTLEVIKELIRHQMDLARLNFSWGTYPEHASFIANIRTAALEAGRRIPIIQDLSGPRVQTSAGHHLQLGAEEIITEKDLQDLTFGLEQAVDYVAMSYVGSADDVEQLRAKIKEQKGHTKIIAKIERQVAVDNLTEIIKVSDAIMVARGDLGNEFPLEQIPFVQRDIVSACKQAHKPVIVATQMMLSMVDNPTPTRAEVTDVAFAVILGADAVMLSEESARGKYAIEAVGMMEKITAEAEKHKLEIEINML